MYIAMIAMIDIDLMFYAYNTATATTATTNS
jgi:hypothetical protein